MWQSDKESRTPSRCQTVVKPKISMNLTTKSTKPEPPLLFVRIACRWRCTTPRLHLMGRSHTSKHLIRKALTVGCQEVQIQNLLKKVCVHLVFIRCKLVFCEHLGRRERAFTVKPQFSNVSCPDQFPSQPDSPSMPIPV